MITGGYDYEAISECPEIIVNDKTAISLDLQCAHLFSESAQDGNKVSFLLCPLGSVSDSNKPSEYAGTAFTMLQMFGLDHEVEKLIGSQANTLSNVLTLGQMMHKAFDKFQIWLEEVPGLVRFTFCPNFFLA